jgi:hypothetical protein
LKPAWRASARISSGVKKLMNGVPEARAPFSAASCPRRSSGSARSIGLVWCGELQAYFVFQHVRRWIELDVQRSP